MGAISETYNCPNNILDLGNILADASPTTSKMERDYY